MNLGERIFLQGKRNSQMKQGLLPPKSVGLLELVAQLRSAQVLAQMRKPLLQLVQSGSK